MQTVNKTLTKYPENTLKRAERALVCSPFKLPLFIAMSKESIPLAKMAENKGLEKDYTKLSLSEGRIESNLMWLISVGLLRREVDGQGITDSFRLTPLGRYLIEKIELEKQWPIPSLWDRILNFFSRWFHLPLF